MMELFQKFISGPTTELYDSLCRAVVEAPTYKPYTNALDVLEELQQGERFEEMLNVVGEVMPNHLLTPTLHYYAGRAHEALGEVMEAEFERKIAVTLIYFETQTGDGTPTKPFMIIHPEQQPEIISFLQRNPVEQALVKHQDGRLFDVWTDGKHEETWFDLTMIARHTPELREHLDNPNLN